MDTHSHRDRQRDSAWEAQFPTPLPITQDAQGLPPPASPSLHKHSPAAPESLTNKQVHPPFSALPSPPPPPPRALLLLKAHTLQKPSRPTANKTQQTPLATNSAFLSLRGNIKNSCAYRRFNLFMSAHLTTKYLHHSKPCLIFCLFYPVCLFSKCNFQQSH